MTTTGQLTAKPPVSPHPNLTATTRAGTAKSGSAIWHVACTCGATFTADAPAIKRGGKKGAVCQTCNRPEHEKSVLAAMPGTHTRIARKTRLSYAAVTYWVGLLRGTKCFVGAWERAEERGKFNPVFHAGQGADVPCELKARAPKQNKRRYGRRVRRAVQKARAGGKEDPRYALHIARDKAEQVIRQARQQPQTWYSALQFK